MIIDRFYRDFSSNKRWVTYRVKVETTDLYIRSKKDLSEFVKKRVIKLRRDIEREIKRNPYFLTSLSPICPVSKQIPVVVKLMYDASKRAGVGPMASVAGAIAHMIGEEIREKNPEVIVENGGDVYLCVNKEVRMSIYAGDSPFSGKIGLKINPHMSPVGVCTSSATVGHSLSLGRADSFTVVSKDTALADAVATGGANRIKKREDVKSAIEYAMAIDGVLGVVAIYKDVIGAKGNIELCEIN